MICLILRKYKETININRKRNKILQFLLFFNFIETLSFGYIKSTLLEDQDMDQTYTDWLFNQMV